MERIGGTWCNVVIIVMGKCVHVGRNWGNIWWEQSLCEWKGVRRSVIANLLEASVEKSDFALAEFRLLT